MSNICFRKGALVHLRPLERKDAPILRRWLNDPEVTRNYRCPFPLMEKGMESWIDGLSGSNTHFSFGIICTKDEDCSCIGTVGLHHIDWVDRTAEYGIQIGEKHYREQGLGTEATMLLLAFAFNTLDLYAVQAKVHAQNAASLACSEACGCTKVGSMPNWVRLHTGERCDNILLAVTQEQWRKRYTEYRKKFPLP